MLYRILSDFVVAVHVAWIVFMILGFVLTGWHFCRVYLFKCSEEKSDRFFNRWIFRIFHLLGIGYVAGLIIMGKYCPLTILENYAKAQYAPEAVYPGSFIIHYIETFVYPDVNPLLLTVPTLVMAVFTLLVFILHPPQKIRGIKKFFRYNG